MPRQLLTPLFLLVLVGKSNAFLIPGSLHPLSHSFSQECCCHHFPSLFGSSVLVPYHEIYARNRKRSSQIKSVRTDDDNELLEDADDDNSIESSWTSNNDRKFSKAQWKKKSFLLMQDIKKRVEEGDYNAHRKAQTMVNRIWTAYEKNSGLDADFIKSLRQAYNLWIHALAKSGWSKAGTVADEVLKEMKEGRFDDESQSLIRIAPDIITYSSVMDAHAKSNSPERAEEVLFELLEDDAASKDVSSYTCDTVLNAWAQLGTQEGAERAQLILLQLERSQQKKIRPTPVSYSTVMNAWAKVGTGNAAEQAEALLLRMINSDENSKTRVQADTVAFNSAIHAWATSGDPRAGSKASTLLRQMKQLAECSKEKNYPAHPDIVTYNTVLSAWSRSGHMNAAPQTERLVKEMIDESTAPMPNTVSYNTILDTWSKSSLPGAAPRAQKVLEYMIRASASKKNVAPDVISFTSTLNAWAKSKEPNKALNARKLLGKLVEVYKSTGKRPALRPTIIPYNTVLNACAFSAQGTSVEERKQALQVAVRTFTELSRSSKRKNDKSIIVPDMVTYGNVIKCFANLMPQGKPRNDMALKIFGQCCEDGLVGTMVWNEVRRAVPSQLLVDTCNLKGSPRSLSINDLPRDWIRNTRFDKRAPKAKTRTRRKKGKDPKQEKKTPMGPRRARMITEPSYQSGFEA